MSEKITLPFFTQYGGGLFGSLFFPEFANAFSKFKPQMYKQLFGNADPNSLQGLYGQYVRPYDPWSYLKDYFGRPGGPTSAENALLNNSLFGVQAPLDFGQVNPAYNNYASLFGGPSQNGGMSILPSYGQQVNPVQYQQMGGIIGDQSGGAGPIPPPQGIPQVNQYQSILQAMQGMGMYGGQQQPAMQMGGQNSELPQGWFQNTQVLRDAAPAGFGQGGAPFSLSSILQQDPGNYWNAANMNSAMPFDGGGGGANGIMAMLGGGGQGGGTQPPFSLSQILQGGDNYWNAANMNSAQPIGNPIGGAGGYMAMNGGGNPFLGQSGQQIMPLGGGGTPFPGNGQSGQYMPFMQGQGGGGMFQVPQNPLFPPQGQSLFNATSADIFNSLGGRLGAPAAPFLPQFQLPQAPDIPAPPSGLGGGFNVPQAPGLPNFNMPAAPQFDIPAWMQETYQSLLQSQPGLQDALKASLNPQIALPGQTIDEIARSMTNDAALKDYVNKATAGMQGAYEQNLNDRLIEMQSRFGAEGSYLGSAMMQGQGELASKLTAEHLSQLGQMQLGAAEQERNRQYGSATQQYLTEYQRNATQVQLQAQQAATMAQQFGAMAAQAASKQGDVTSQTYAQQLDALAREYSSKASYLASTYGSMVSAMASGFGSQQSALASMYGSQLGAMSNIYGSQVGAMANAYGTQGNFLSNIYNTGMGAYSNQQSIVANATNQAMQLMQSGMAQNWEMAFKMAMAQQQNQQGGLDKLWNMYYTPGQNAKDILGMFFGLPSVSKSTGGGFDIGGFLNGLGNAGGLFFK